MTSIEMVNTKETTAIAIRKKVKVSEIPAVMGSMFGELYPHLGKDVRCAGPPFALYHSWEGEMMDMEVGFPIVGKGVEAGNVRTIKLPAVRAAMAMHIGPYDKLMDTYNEMMGWMKVNGHQPASFMWEEYLNSPQEVPPSQLMTRLYWPVI
ncbi:MAG TPA: GyrI-like domain-containing protein [Methanomassiliicoccales archaeon]|nr:GyrI-like domain-containing protein [Methanomassiliicoccales archaeon]